MPGSLKQIEAQVFALSVADRARLAAALLESLRRPSPEARQRAEARTRWSEKIQQRIEMIEGGDSDVFAGLDEDELADIRRAPA